MLSSMLHLKEGGRRRLCAAQLCLVSWRRLLWPRDDLQCNDNVILCDDKLSLLCVCLCALHQLSQKLWHPLLGISPLRCHKGHWMHSWQPMKWKSMSSFYESGLQTKGSERILNSRNEDMMWKARRKKQLLSLDHKNYKKRKKLLCVSISCSCCRF